MGDCCQKQLDEIVDWLDSFYSINPKVEQIAYLLARRLEAKQWKKHTGQPVRLEDFEGEL